MQHLAVLPLRWPGLETRRIASYSSKVRIVQEVDNIILRADTSPPLSVYWIMVAQLSSQSSLCALLLRLVVVRIDKSGANEQDIANLDITTVARWPQIDALALGRLLQLIVGDGVVDVWVILDAVGLCVAPVVDEDTASTDAVVSPVVDGALVFVLAWTVDVVACCAVIELGGGNVRNVAETIPLGSGLSVQGIDIIIGHAWVQRLDVVAEWLATETWDEWLVEWKVQGDNVTVLNVLRSRLDARWGEEVEATELLILLVTTLLAVLTCACAI